jgi:hypothetical protein
MGDDRAAAGEGRPIQQQGAKHEPQTVVKGHCNICGGEKNAFRRASHTVRGNDGEVSWSDTYEILECCGCSGMAVRHSSWFSEWDTLDNDPVTGRPRIIPGVEVSYWPPPTRRKKPDWGDDLEDDVLRQVIDEVYQALNGGLTILASIGTRTLLDRGMFLRVGDPNGGFGGKLNEMVSEGYIGRGERETFEAITDAGNAAAHRGFSPKPEMLNTIVALLENFLHREFVLKTAAGQLRTATPPRPKRPTSNHRHA